MIKEWVRKDDVHEVQPMKMEVMMAALMGRFDRIKESQARMEDIQVRMEAQLQRIENNMANANGENEDDEMSS